MNQKILRVIKGVMLNIKLDVVKCFDGSEQNEDIVCVLNIGLGNTQNFFHAD